MSNHRHTTPVAAGVFGVGSMGRHHARVYDALSDVRLVGVHDADRERAREIGSRHDVPAMTTPELLEAADVVSVAVPTQYHAPITRKCIDAGVDVLVEKPFVADAEEGRALARRAREAGVTLQVGHIERFNPAIEALRPLLADADVQAIRACRLGPPLERDVEDSVVLDLMVHDIDLALSLVGSDVASLHAMGTHDGNYATSTLKFEDGVVGTLTASRITERRIRSLWITTDDAFVDVDFTDQSVGVHRRSLPEYVERNGDVNYRHESVIERPIVERGEPLKNELRAFVDAAIAGEEPRVTPEEALCALETARRIDDMATGDRRRDRLAPREDWIVGGDG